MDCSAPGFPVHHQLLDLTQTEVHRGLMASNHLILCRPLFLPPSIFPSIRVFSNESVLRNPFMLYRNDLKYFLKGCLELLVYFPRGSAGKESAYSVGDLGLIPGSGRSPDQEREMAAHSSILAWEIPRTEEPGGLQSTG